MVKTIKPQAFDIELQGSADPFLVAFLKRNDRYAEQADALEGAEKANENKVRCYLLNADYLDTAMERFKVKGTPTFLLFHQGREVDRFIGESDGTMLDDFIKNSIGK